MRLFSVGILDDEKKWMEKEGRERARVLRNEPGLCGGHIEVFSLVLSNQYCSNALLAVKLGR